MKLNYVLMIILIALIILVGIYYTLDKINKEKCYNMPIAEYIESQSCTNYTWEDYMEEHYGK